MLSIDEFHPFKFSTGQKKKKKKKKKNTLQGPILFKACVLVQVTVPSQTCLYRLVSVVEHYGIAGSGHYTVYRSVRADSHKEVPDEQFEPATSWFCVSDSEVHGVSEKDVLDAEASLLFYEKIV